MSDLSIDSMFTESSYEIRQPLAGRALSEQDRKRMLTHMIADMTQKILAAPGASPEGLTITVSSLTSPAYPDSRDLLIIATCPQHELSDFPSD